MSEITNQKVVQGLRTAERLVEIASEVFCQRGYSSATTQEIIDIAGVTKGALYHHFPSKPALFEAVYRRAESEMGERIQAASTQKKDPFEQLKAGCFTYIECCAEEKLHRILRLDGPSALGAEKWRDIDREFGADRLLPFIKSLTQDRVIKVPSAEAFTYQLTGAMNEATFWIAQQDNKRKAIKESKATLSLLLESVRV